MPPRPVISAVCKFHLEFFSKNRLRFEESDEISCIHDVVSRIFLFSPCRKPAFRARCAASKSPSRATAFEPFNLTDGAFLTESEQVMLKNVLNRDKDCRYVGLLKSRPQAGLGETEWRGESVCLHS